MRCVLVQAWARLAHAVLFTAWRFNNAARRRDVLLARRQRRDMEARVRSRSWRPATWLARAAYRFSASHRRLLVAAQADGALDAAVDAAVAGGSNPTAEVVLATGIASIGAEPKFPGLLDRHGEDAEERATRRACAWPWVETSLLGRATMAAALVVLRRNVVQVRRATVGACVDVHVSSRREG